MRIKRALILSVFLFFSPITVYAQDELILGGNSVGIEIQYDGVYVSGTYPINDQIDPADTFLPGDIIKTIENQPIHDLSTFYAVLKEYTDPINVLDITIQRNHSLIDATMKTAYDHNRHSMSCGLYIKEKMSGVGTMTFYDPSTKRFAALGHAIEQVDEEPIGNLYDAQIIDYTKATTGATGEKKADIQYDEVIGIIDQNTSIGIYGNYQIIPSETRSLPWADVDEVKLGKASIYTVLEDQTIESYEIMITKLNAHTQDDMKGIAFQVIDERLLGQTGGIIQGMSGSPIVQNGKIIGAVTHVVTDSPENGYGVFVEYMLHHTRSS